MKKIIFLLLIGTMSLSCNSQTKNEKNNQETLKSASKITPEIAQKLDKKVAEKHPNYDFYYLDGFAYKNKYIVLIANEAEKKSFLYYYSKNFKFLKSKVVPYEKVQNDILSIKF